MMKFEDHSAHNRYIKVTFDDSQLKLGESNKYVRSLTKEMGVYVNHLVDGKASPTDQAIRLDNEVMHLVKAAPALLFALQVAEKYVPDGAQSTEEANTDLEIIKAAISAASKTTY